MLNLTQHKATEEQIAAGVTEPSDKQAIKQLLTFETIPTREELSERAAAIALLAAEDGATEAMIGGAPFFMGHLEVALHQQGVQPFYAFSKRVVVENDGVKTSVFEHIGFVHGNYA